MRTILALAAISVAALTFNLGPVVAQEAERATAISACTVPPVDSAECTAAVAAFAAALEGLPTDEADALLGKNDLEGAAVRFRAYLGRDKRPPSWTAVAIWWARSRVTSPAANTPGTFVCWSWSARM